MSKGVTRSRPVRKATYELDERTKTKCTTCSRISSLVLLVIIKTNPYCLPKAPINKLARPVGPCLCIIFKNFGKKFPLYFLTKPFQKPWKEISIVHFSNKKSFGRDCHNLPKNFKTFSKNLSCENSYSED